MTMPRRPYLTTRAQEAFSLAFDIAAERGHDDVTATHVGLGMLREGRSIALHLLRQRGISLDALARELEAALPPAGPARTAAPTYAWTPGAERWVEAAADVAQVVGTEYYGSEHLLLALVRDDTTVPAQLLARRGVGSEELQADYQLLRDEQRRLAAEQERRDPGHPPAA